MSGAYVPAYGAGSRKSVGLDDQRKGWCGLYSEVKLHDSDPEPVPPDPPDPPAAE